LVVPFRPLSFSFCDKIMKLLIGILILVELLLILGMACPIFVDNEDHARAVATYIQNPNPESLANLQDEKDKTDAIRLITKIILWGALLLNSVALIFALIIRDKSAEPTAQADRKG